MNDGRVDGSAAKKDSTPFMDAMEWLKEQGAVGTADDNESVATWAEGLRWSGTLACPFCSSRGVVPTDSKHQFTCRTCEQMFSVRTGTPFEHIRKVLLTCLVVAHMTIKGTSTAKMTALADASEPTVNKIKLGVMDRLKGIDLTTRPMLELFRALMRPHPENIIRPTSPAPGKTAQPMPGPDRGGERVTAPAAKAGQGNDERAPAYRAAATTGDLRELLDKRIADLEAQVAQIRVELDATITYREVLGNQDPPG